MVAGSTRMPGGFMATPAAEVTTHDSQRLV